MAFPNENVIKNVANEITRECVTFHVTVDTEFVIYMLKLIILNPEYGKLFSGTLNRKKLEVFVKICVNKLLDTESPTLITMKMQLYFEANYDNYKNLIDKNMSTIESRLAPLVREIIKAEPSTREDEEKLFRKMSIYFVLNSGLGNPGNLNVLREGTAALNSIFTVEDIGEFMSMPQSQKYNQLSELMGIVSGIRLFNKDCEKAGEGIPDVPSNLTESSQASSLALTNCLVRIVERVNILTSAIDAHIGIGGDGKTMVVIENEDDFTIGDFNIVSKVLNLYRQYEVIVRQLIATIETVVAEAKFSVAAYKDSLEEAHSIVRYRLVVLAKQIFPIFSTLWSHWRKMQGDLYVVSSLNALIAKLDSIHEQMTFTTLLADKLLAGRQVDTDNERLGRTACENIIQENNLCNVVEFKKLKVTDPSQFAYVGFCAMCVCVGALIPANPHMGTLVWNNKIYVFSTSALAAQFGTQPDRYIKEALHYVRQNPELINLLKIYSDIFDVHTVRELVPPSSITKIIETKAVQTDLHPDNQITIASELKRWEFDRYNWNLWEHKRIACRWASIVNCKTHATQTHLSHMRTEIACQTEEKRDKMHQTRKEQGTNVPKLQTFIWGLRGQRGKGQHVVDLTQPVDKP